MLRPSEFLHLAKILALPEQDGLYADAAIRKSISTAYYALFHVVLTAAAERFFGAEQADKAGFRILYRTFNHGQMKHVCDAIARGTLGASLREQLGRGSVHADLCDFAFSFVDLQDRRLEADYDPQVRLSDQDALTAVRIAEEAVAAFERAPAGERADVLALMLATNRR